MIQHFFEIAEQNEGQETGGEVSCDAGVSAEINGPGLEFMLHNSEALFNFQKAMIDLHNRFRIFIQICRDSIKATVLFLIPNLLFIPYIVRIAGNFAILCYGNSGNEPLVIALPCAILLAERYECSLSTGNLFVSDFSLVAAVFQGKGHDILLLNIVFIDPGFFVKRPLSIKILLSKQRGLIPTE